MAESKFTVAKQGDIFRVVRGGEPQPDLDNGGFSARQDALDAAAAANLQIDRNPSGMGIGEQRTGRMNAVIDAMSR